VNNDIWNEQVTEEERRKRGGKEKDRSTILLNASHPATHGNS
jgi:hypothetical protein